MVHFLGASHLLSDATGGIDICVDMIQIHFGHRRHCTRTKKLSITVLLSPQLYFLSPSQIRQAICSTSLSSKFRNLKHIFSIQPLTPSTLLNVYHRRALPTRMRILQNFKGLPTWLVISHPEISRSAENLPAMSTPAFYAACTGISGYCADSTCTYFTSDTGSL